MVGRESSSLVARACSQRGALIGPIDLPPRVPGRAAKRAVGRGQVPTAGPCPDLAAGARDARGGAWGTGWPVGPPEGRALLSEWSGEGRPAPSRRGRRPGRAVGVDGHGPLKRVPTGGLGILLPNFGGMRRPGNRGVGLRIRGSGARCEVSLHQESPMELCRTVGHFGAGDRGFWAEIPKRFIASNNLMT